MRRDHIAAAATSIELCLLYGGATIATYEFSDLSDANSFLVKVKEVADSDPRAKVSVRVVTEVIDTQLA